MQLLVDEQVVNYQIVGSGQTILMVHGWADSLFSFYDLQNSLSRDYQVVTLDLPGFGQSSTPDKAWWLEDYANFLAEFTRKLNLNVFAYVGHSNGGPVLIKGLAEGKLQAERLVLLASAGIREKAKLKKEALKLTAKSGKAVTSVLPNRIQGSIRKRFYGAIGSEMLLVPQLEQTFKNIIGQDIKSDASKLSTPTLLIYGQDDKDTPHEDGQLLESLINGSKFVLIENAGHFVHRDQPLMVEKLIKDFLK